MSEESQGLTTGDRLRYGFLLLLGSLLWLSIFGRREGGVASLFAVYLLMACGAALWVRTRKDRS